MAGSLKKIFIIGNLGSDPVMRYTADGTPVTTFNVAVNERPRRSQGQGGDPGAAQREEITTWFRVSAWRNQAEIANNLLKKGTSVFVSGDLRTSEFTGQDGKLRTTLEVSMQDMQILTPKGVQELGSDASFGGGQSASGNTPSYGNRPAAPAAADPGFDDESDIPF
jgi:single-strand DNA-binding protein